ncbi:MAG: peptide-methionine (R)-S-oxide reductase [Patescibacteria group bacterium]
MNEEEIQAKLTPEEYRVMREGGIEDPYTGDFLNDGPPGTYICKLCAQPLFESTAKFNLLTGWPSFDRAIDGAVEEYASKWMEKPAVGAKCMSCKSFLGRIVERGPTETNRSYYIYSVALSFDSTKIPAPREKPIPDSEITTAETTTP